MNIIQTLFHGMQKNLEGMLSTARVAIDHPGVKGTVSENNWRSIFEQYLPQRYKVDSGIVVDSNGSKSDQIDLVVYDNQYSTLVFKQDGVSYLPAESVYTCFEVKQTLSGFNLDYTKNKILSIQNLFRSSTSINHAGGTFPPKTLHQIKGGILCLESDYSPKFSEAFNEKIKECENIVMGCVVKEGSFFKSEDSKIEFSDEHNSLVFFIYKLLAYLQSIGTVPAIDYDQYLRNIQRSN